MYVKFLFLSVIHSIILTEGMGMLGRLFNSLIRTNGYNRFDYTKFEYKFQVQCDHEELNGDLLNQMNEFKTLETTSVVIEPHEVHLLMTDCKTDENCIRNRSVVLDKSRVKVQMIQCVNGLIVGHMIDQISDVAKKEGPPYPVLIELMKLYRIILARMLSIIYSFKLMVYDWQMMVYINILTALQHNHNHITQYIVPIITAVDSVTLHTNFCREHGYLDIDSIKNLNMDEIMIKFYQNDKLYCGYVAADLMTVQNFRLESLHQRYSVILGESESYRFKWRRTMDTYYKGIVSIISLRNQGRWSLQPYDTWPAYNVVMTMVYSKVLYHTWIQLSVYRSNMTSEEHISEDRQRTLREYLNLLVEPLKEAIRIFDIVDNAIWPVYRLLRRNDEIIDPEQLETALYVVRGVLEKSLRLMKTDGVSRTLTKKYTNIEILDETDLDTNKNNIEELKTYIKNMKASFPPNHIIFFIRFFIKSFNNKSFWIDGKWTNYYE
ncbi:uncharacterized protein LOC126834599 [Adelges cooleyi]|uniref:uncharacterized protein LOC126834599 n=1 Tax=Adelges cooleyi TaxID=133065 RepID=UPI002180492B|nr:uncharacterized protein LOC126834599 [Adelges cooleyi]